MDTLHYLKLANLILEKPQDHKVSINIITNFTDDVLKRLLTGVVLDHGMYPEIIGAPYHQYHVFLKNLNKDVGLRSVVTFIFFDINVYINSEFALSSHVDDVLEDIRKYVQSAEGAVILNTALLPYYGTYGNLYRSHHLFKLVERYNKHLADIAAEYANAHLCDINRLVHTLGESHVRDHRGLHAFDMPFSTHFLLELAQEWFSYIAAITGKVRKCIIVDLDNTLWGGIVGELGPTGIELGPTYPGNAFQSFQRILKEYSSRGIILAINSRNNPGDIDEVFEKNTYMVLQRSDFSAVRINWNNKAENILAIAEELGIGLDSMIFFDDDPLNRDLVRLQLPEVLVPELPSMPEQYGPFVHSLRDFNQLSITDEDKSKTKMYSEEMQRKAIFKDTASVDEYIAQLGIKLEITENNASLMPRAAQLTQKTNQFNLTTHRYTEADILSFIDDGARIFTGTVSDKFGNYGTVMLAIIRFMGDHEINLDTFLMSCRVMGRSVEYNFLDAVIRQLAEGKYVKRLTAQYTPTLKNSPASGFLAEMGFIPVAEESGGSKEFALDVEKYCQTTSVLINKGITVYYRD